MLFTLYKKLEHNTFIHDNSSNSGTGLEGKKQVDNIHGNISFLLLHGFQ